MATAAALAAILTMLQCHLLTGDYQTVASLDAGTAGAGAGTTTSTTAAGGAERELVSQDLLARYFLDDAQAGDRPQQATDSAGAPVLPLNIDYEAGSGGAGTYGISWSEREGNRGLEWLRPDGSGIARTPIADTKVTDALTSSPAMTLELVTQLEGSVDDTRLLTLGASSAGFLSLRVHDATELELQYTINLTVVGRWQVALLERQVLHVVIDTARQQEDDRVELYADGVLVSNADHEPVPQNELLNITDGELMLGNDGNWHSIQGILFYAALYGRAMTSAQIANNAAILAVDDDSPE